MSAIPPPRIVAPVKRDARRTRIIEEEKLPSVSEEEMERIARRVRRAFPGSRDVPVSDGHYLEPNGVTVKEAKKEAADWRRYWNELAERTKGTEAHVPKVRSIEVIECPVCGSVWVTSTRVAPASRYSCRSTHCPGVANVVKARF